MKVAFALLLPGALLSVSARADLLIKNRSLERGQTVARALQKAGLSDHAIEGVVGALEGVFDFRRAKEGDQIRLVSRDGELDLFDYRQGPLEEWQVRREGDRWVGTKRSIEVERRVVLVDLNIESSLYEAASAAGEDPVISMVLSDVFAWDIDFYQDVRRGDHARAVVEKFLSKGRLVRYGDVLAARYDGSAVGQKRIYRYLLPDGSASYFQPDGSSARKTFLKSPLKFAHITSRFGSRFHPILQYVKAHNGVDYGTPVGTPVWAVADGTVVRAGHEAASGNHVCVRHPNSLETCYLHLSGFGKGVHVGARVSQKQVIGFSGNSGRSTGPHLHFALKRGGHFVNPLNQNFPRAEPVPRELLQDFSEKTSGLAQQLDALPVADARGTGVGGQ